MRLRDKWALGIIGGVIAFVWIKNEVVAQQKKADDARFDVRSSEFGQWSSVPFDQSVAKVGDILQLIVFAGTKSMFGVLPDKSRPRHVLVRITQIYAPNVFDALVVQSDSSTFPAGFSFSSHGAAVGSNELLPVTS